MTIAVVINVSRRVGLSLCAQLNRILGRGGRSLLGLGWRTILKNRL